MGSFDYSDDYSSFDNLLDRTTLLTEGGVGLGGYHPSFGSLRKDIEDVGGVGTYRARQFVVRLLYTYLEPPIITGEELDYIQKSPEGRSRGAARPEYNTALTEVLDKHKDEIAQRADEIGDALEENFPALANEILGVNPEKARMKIATRAAEKEIKKAAKKIKQGEDAGEAVGDAVEDILSADQEKVLANAAVYTALTKSQGMVSDRALDAVEKYAVEYVNSFSDLDKLINNLKTKFDNEDFNMLADELSFSLSSVKRRARISEDEEDPYAGMNDPGDPEGEEYSKNLEGGRTSIVDSLNNDMRKRKLLFEKKKNWMKGAVKKPGALNAAAKAAGKSKLEYCASPPSGKAEKRCNLWKTFNKYRPEDNEERITDVFYKYVDKIEQDIHNGKTFKESMISNKIDSSHWNDLFDIYTEYMEDKTEGPIETGFEDNEEFNPRRDAPEHKEGDPHPATRAAEEIIGTMVTWNQDGPMKGEVVDVDVEQGFAVVETGFGIPPEKYVVELGELTKAIPRAPREDEEDKTIKESYTNNYLSEQKSSDKRNIKPRTENQSFKERYKPKTHWQLEELRRMGL